MMGLSTATETAHGMLEKGELVDLAAAQIAIVRMMGVRIIDSRIPREARIALNAGVKQGQIGHLPKKGLLPEAFFHPNARWHAMEVRNRIKWDSVDALRKVLGVGGDEC